MARLTPFFWYIGIFFLSILKGQGQQTGGLMESMIDTARQRRREESLEKLEFLRFSGYIQPQFQVAERAGQQSFNGGNFAPATDNRFLIRRGRLRVDYAHNNARKQPTTLFVFQFDCTERGVFVRDLWGRFYENKWELFHFTTGIFARPFGFEVNYSSSDRESPERGRMSQLLMRTERDLGAMLSLSPRQSGHPLRQFRLDVGLFNGPGLTAITDYDSQKDLIGRLSFRQLEISRKGLTLSGSVSGFRGGFEPFTSAVYRTEAAPGGPRFTVDPVRAITGSAVPRRYYGADLQLRIPNRKGFTELRGEFIAGVQTATQNSTETPVNAPSAGGPADTLFVRPFNGAYFYFLQHLGSTRHQFVAKYDWYDPNSRVRRQQLRPAGKTTDPIGYTWADIRYATLGLGYLYYFSEELKATVWYEIVRNESTGLPGYRTDVPDNQLTLRLQYRF